VSRLASDWAEIPGPEGCEKPKTLRGHQVCATAQSSTLDITVGAAMVHEKDAYGF
jgi:hypothetical protein